jgi:hypothetical protein
MPLQQGLNYRGKNRVKELVQSNPLKYTPELLARITNVELGWMRRYLKILAAEGSIGERQTGIPSAQEVAAAQIILRAASPQPEPEPVTYDEDTIPSMDVDGIADDMPVDNIVDLSTDDEPSAEIVLEDEHGPLPGTDAWAALKPQQKAGLTKKRNNIATAM